ncbi:MAG: hypothetical protein ACJ0DH_05695, partial [bacterium]
GTGGSTSIDHLHRSQTGGYDRASTRPVLEVMSLIRNLVFLVLLFLAYLCRLPGVGHGCFTGLVGQHRIFRILPGKWGRSLGLGSGPGTWRPGGAGVGPGQKRGVPMIY